MVFPPDDADSFAAPSSGTVTLSTLKTAIE
jgi:hypothetical protein